MNIKLALILCFLLFSFSCGNDRSPLAGTGTGVMRIVVSEEGYGGAETKKTPEGVKKTTSAAGLDNLEVRILKSDNTVLASRVFTPVYGVFNVLMAVEATDDLKVLCIGMKNGVVGHFGLNEDVDIKLGKTTIVIIEGWNDPFNPEIGSIKPNPSQDGNFTLSWTQPPNATTYVVQEADNDKFSGVSTVYSGTDLQKSITGKNSGTWYYRVQAASHYNVNSKWSAASSVVVSIAQRKYTVSGTVTGADDVTVTLSGDASDIKKVNSGGEFSFSVNEKGNYTLTASKTGFLFTPSSKTFSSISSNQVQNFIATRITHTISGTVTGTDGVIVTLSGDSDGSQIVNNGGKYSFTVPEGGNFTVTPSQESSAFNPSNGAFTNVRANIIQDFAVALNKATLSGTVTGADSVKVTLSGDASEIQTVNDGGSYTFTVQQGKNFTVTPSKAGYVFTPASKTFSAVTVNQKQNFTASRIMRTISGTVTGASGVTVSLSGGATDSRVVSIDGGSWSFSVPDGGTFTVTAVKSGYTLSPPSKTFAKISADQTFNFSAIRITHTISGTVTGADAVTVTLSGDFAATQTVNSGGSYSFSVGEGGVYTVTPTKTGYTFTPASRTFTNVITEQAVNFTAQAQVIISDVKMVSIPGGTFQMGQVGVAEPVHSVTITAFEMSIYEITQGQYKAAIGTNPSYFTGDDNLPVERVSWWDAIKYCNALSVKAGFGKCYDETFGYCDFSKNGFRLPTEAEWEYACRAGTTTRFNLGDAESDLGRAAWYFPYSYEVTHPVGQKTPNNWGFYDMHGNVWEWCGDWYGSYTAGSQTDPTGIQTGTIRVIRGGSWTSYFDFNCLSATRENSSPNGKSNDVGFRVVRR
jgi:formylglycine-generating enzyme required for sulfatase activity